jgi:hypothetical protein
MTLLGLNAIALTILSILLFNQFDPVSKIPTVEGAPIPNTALPAPIPAVAGPLRPDDPAPGALIKPWFTPLSGPWRIAIQVGHLDNLDLPKELAHLRGNDGAVVNKVKEWQINQSVALALAKRLRRSGMEVQVLPSTIPHDLRVDAFIAIHCDWADRSRNHGWKVVAPPQGNLASRDLAAALSAAFAAEDSLSHDPAAYSDTLTDYYAFNRRTYQHSIAALSPGVIVELGFMSNPAEFRLLRNRPDSYAAILERGLEAYLSAFSRSDLSRLVANP